MGDKINDRTNETTYERTQKNIYERFYSRRNRQLPPTQRTMHNLWTQILFTKKCVCLLQDNGQISEGMVMNEEQLEEAARKIETEWDKIASAQTSLKQFFKIRDWLDNLLQVIEQWQRPTMGYKLERCSSCGSFNRVKNRN